MVISIDFWFVKNVSGRILVGLRWWNGEDINHNQGWFFESYDIENYSSFVDSYVFWWSLIISTGYWAFVLLLKILSLGLFWGMLVFIAGFLNATNLYGYYLCKKDHEQKIQNMIVNFSKKYKPIYNTL